MGKTLKVVNEWDPMNLLSHAPEDEYEEEVKLINELLSQTNNVNELALGIHSIFTKMGWSALDALLHPLKTSEAVYEVARLMMLYTITNDEKYLQPLVEVFD